MTQRLNTQVLRSSTTVFAINDREETTASAMASVKTYVLVTLVVFVQLVESTLGGCVFGQYVFRFFVSNLRQRHCCLRRRCCRYRL